MARSLHYRLKKIEAALEDADKRLLRLRVLKRSRDLETKLEEAEALEYSLCEAFSEAQEVAMEISDRAEKKGGGK